MEWSTMVVPTYTLKVAATPCRCANTTIRLCESATLSGCHRLKEHVARDCSGRFGRNLHGVTAHTARSMIP
jgi:hypothetical protein